MPNPSDRYRHLPPLNEVKLSGPALALLTALGMGAFLFWEGSGNGAAVYFPYGSSTALPSSGRAAKMLADLSFIWPSDDPGDVVEDVGLHYYLNERGVAYLAYLRNPETVRTAVELPV